MQSTTETTGVLTRRLHLVIEICGNRFYSKITDQGDGFDPSTVPDPTEEENLEKDCGPRRDAHSKFCRCRAYTTTKAIPLS